MSQYIHLLRVQKQTSCNSFDPIHKFVKTQSCFVVQKEESIICLCIHKCCEKHWPVAPFQNFRQTLLRTGPRNNYGTRMWDDWGRVDNCFIFIWDTVRATILKKNRSPNLEKDKKINPKYSINVFINVFIFCQLHSASNIIFFLPLQFNVHRFEWQSLLTHQHRYIFVLAAFLYTYFCASRAHVYFFAPQKYFRLFSYRQIIFFTLVAPPLCETANQTNKNPSERHHGPNVTHCVE